MAFVHTIALCSPVDSTFYANCHLATFATCFQLQFPLDCESIQLLLSKDICLCMCVSEGVYVSVFRLSLLSIVVSSRRLAINFTISWQPVAQGTKVTEGQPGEPPDGSSRQKFKKL